MYATKNYLHENLLFEKKNRLKMKKIRKNRAETVAQHGAFLLRRVRLLVFCALPS